MTEQTVDTTPPEQPPPPIPCAICESTAHTTGNHNGTGPATAAADDATVDDPEMSPQGNHNGTKAG